jgi:hypothetical protein
MNMSILCLGQILGLTLALGSVIDVNASEREKQFLPDYMEAGFWESFDRR